MMGTGFYKFSQDEEQRKAQQEALKNIRAETLQNRAQAEKKKKSLKELRKTKIMERKEKIKAAIGGKERDNIIPRKASAATSKTEDENDAPVDVKSRVEELLRGIRKEVEKRD